MFCSELNLKKPIYQKTASYGHFGRDQFTWEQPKQLKIRPELEIKIQKLKNNNHGMMNGNGNGVHCNGDGHVLTNGYNSTH